MHELKQEFEILLARLDCLITLVEKGSPAASEHIIPGLKEQAEKTRAVLDKTILDFRTFDAVGDLEADDPDPEIVRMAIPPGVEIEVEGEEEEDGEYEYEGDDEDEDDEDDEDDEEETPTKEG